MNKKTLAIILSIALAIGAFAGLSFNLFSASAEEYVGDGVELVTNGGCDNYLVGFGGKNLYWFTGRSADAVKDVTGDPSNDGKALEIGTRNPAGAGTRAFFASPGSKVTETGKYIFSMYVLFPEATADQNIWIELDTTTNPEAETADKFVVPANTWTKIYTVADLTADVAYFPGIYTDATSGAEKLYIDFVSVQKVVKAPQYVTDGNEMVTDGNAPATAGDTVYLGSQKIAHWTTESGTSTVNIGQDSVAGTDADGNGRYFAVAKIESNASSLPALRSAQVFTMTIDGFEAGNKYVVSAYAKLPAGSTATVNAHLATCATYQTQVAEADSYLTHKSEVVALTTEWQKIELVIDYAGAGDGTKGSGDKYLGLVIDTPAAVDVDAISIQKMIEAKGNGIEMVTDGNAPATAGDTVYLVNEKIAHFKTAGGTTQYNLGQDSVAGTDADGNGRYFAVAKIELTNSEASNSHLRNKLPFFMTIDGFTEGEKYIVSAYAKLPAGSTDTLTAQLGTAATYAIHLAGGDPYLTHKSEVVTLTAEWQKIEFIVEYNGVGDGTKGSGDKFLGLILSAPAAVDVDAVSIQKIGAPAQDGGDQGGAQDKYTENLFAKHANGSFNNGADIAPLYATEKTSWAVEIVSTDSQDNDGKSALVSVRGVDYAAPRAKATDIINAYGAGKYTFTAYVKSTGADVTLQPVIQMVWGEAYNNDNVVAGTSVGKWKTGTTEIINGTKWTRITAEFEIELTAVGSKGDTLQLREVICYAKDTAFNALFAPDMLVDNLSLVKEINGQENQTLIDQLGGTTNEGGNGGSNAGSSNTGDVLPVALIAVVVVSAAALVVVARRKREE